MLTLDDLSTPRPWYVEAHGIMDATRSRTICLIGDSDQDRADAEHICMCVNSYYEIAQHLAAAATPGTEEG